MAQESTKVKKVVPTWQEWLDEVPHASYILFQRAHGGPYFQAMVYLQLEGDQGGIKRIGLGKTPQEAFEDAYSIVMYLVNLPNKPLSKTQQRKAEKALKKYEREVISLSMDFDKKRCPDCHGYMDPQYGCIKRGCGRVE